MRFSALSGYFDTKFSTAIVMQIITQKSKEEVEYTTTENIRQISRQFVTCYNQVDVTKQWLNRRTWPRKFSHEEKTPSYLKIIAWSDKGKLYLPYRLAWHRYV